MMHSFNYYYRKSYFLPRLFMGVFFIGFIMVWSSMALSILGIIPDDDSPMAGPFSQIRIIFLGVPALILCVGLFLALPSLFKILSPRAVVTGDGQGLTIRGPWFRKYQFTWSELAYLRYEQRAQFYRNPNTTLFGSFMHEFIMVKPKTGKTVSINISQLDAAIDDIIADVNRLAPNLEIRGFDK